MEQPSLCDIIDIDNSSQNIKLSKVCMSLYLMVLSVWQVMH